MLSLAYPSTYTHTLCVTVKECQDLFRWLDTRVSKTVSVVFMNLCICKYMLIALCEVGEYYYAHFMMPKGDYVFQIYVILGSFSLIILCASILWMHFIRHPDLTHGYGLCQGGAGTWQIPDLGLSFWMSAAPMGVETRTRISYTTLLNLTSSCTCIGRPDHFNSYFVCRRRWIAQGWIMMTKQHLFCYFLHLEEMEIFLKPGYGIILVKFVLSRSLSLEFPLVFIKDEEEKQEGCLFYWSCDMRDFHLRNLLESLFSETRPFKNIMFCVK